MIFRDFLDQLESRSELVRISAEVDRDFELGALLRQAEERNRACWFERVSGSPFAAVGGVMTSPERHAMSISRAPSELATLDGYARLLSEARQSPIPACIVDSAPVGEVVISGEEIDAGLLPAPRFFDGDSHRFLTAAIGFAMDPESGIQNVGFYRTPIIDQKRISAGASPASNLSRIYRAAKARGEKLPIALVLGAPPALLLTAGARVPPEVSDTDVAGALQGSPVELVKCRTSDLLVPAQAEIVIEALVDTESEIEHVMGEYGDQFGLTVSPVATVTAITHRRDPIFHVIMAGMNREHNALGILAFCDLRQELLSGLREKFDCVTDLNVDFTPRRGGTRAQAVVAIDKTDPAQPGQVIDAVFGSTSGAFPLRALLQRVVVVDGDVDITNPDDIEWAISTRMDARDKLMASEDTSRRGDRTARLGIDATMDIEARDRLRRPAIPGAASLRLDEYI